MIKPSLSPGEAAKVLRRFCNMHDLALGVGPEWVTFSQALEVAIDRLASKPTSNPAPVPPKPKPKVIVTGTIKVGDTVNYWSGSGRSHPAQVTVVHPEPTKPGSPPMVSLQFTDSCGAVVCKDHVLHRSANPKQKKPKSWEFCEVSAACTS